MGVLREPQLAELKRPRPLALVADDEPLIDATLVEILAGEGVDTMCVSTGESALFWALQAKPDFLVLDVMMPKLGGIEVAKQLQSKLPQAKIILFSGTASSRELIEKTRAEGLTCEVLAKPISPDALLEKMGVSQPGKLNSQD